MGDRDIAGQVEEAFGRYQFRHPLSDLMPLQRRTPILSRPRVAMAAVVVVVVAVASWAVWMSPIAVGPTLAFVDWQAVPEAPNAGFASAAAERCHVGASMSLVAQDQRGNAAALVYSGGGELAVCLIAQNSAGTIVTAASGSTHLDIANGPLSVDTGLSAPASSQSPGVRILTGRASAPISSVYVARSDGVDVTATVSSGYWVAWWPTTGEGTTVTSTDSRGTVIQVAAALN